MKQHRGFGDGEPDMDRCEGCERPGLIVRWFDGLRLCHECEVEQVDRLADIEATYPDEEFNQDNYNWAENR